MATARLYSNSFFGASGEKVSYPLDFRSSSTDSFVFGVIFSAIFSPIAFVFLVIMGWISSAAKPAAQEGVLRFNSGEEYV